MNRNILFFFIFVILASCSAFAQKFAVNNARPKKLVIIPLLTDTTQSKNFCVCKIVTFTSGNYQQRTDAIFAGSSQEKPVARKNLLKHIEYELQQALVFFDSYKQVSQVAAKADCNILYKYLETQLEKINSYTVLLPAFASH